MNASLAPISFPPSSVRSDFRLFFEGRLYVADPAQQQALDAAIKAVLADNGARPDSRIAALVILVQGLSRPSTVPINGLFDSCGLTAAETRVALAAADGALNGEIAVKLHLSRNTVKTHLRRVYEKLGINRQAQLVRMVALAATARSGCSQ